MAAAVTHDPAWLTPFSVSVIQISDAYFVHFLLQQYPHIVINLAYMEATVEVE